MSEKRDQLADEQMWKRPEVVKFTGLCDSYVKRLTARNQIPNYKIGWAVRYSPSEIRAWFKKYKRA